MTRNEQLIPRSELLLYDEDDSSSIALSGLVRAIKPDSLLVSNFEPLFIVGPHACGKSSLARHSLNDVNHRFFDTGPLLRSYHRADSPDETFRNWVTSSEKDYGDTFTDDVLAGHISASLQTDTDRKAVIIGHRSLAGIDRISDLLGSLRRTIVYINAPADLLYERYQHRENRNVSPSEFEELLERDRRLGQTALIDAADVVIQNDSDFEAAAQELKTKVAS